jgi:ribonuclease BN (tRNA processing enzyme)
VFLTDNELGFVHPGGLPAKNYYEFCQGADLLFHDAEYTSQEYKLLIEWGHSSYTDVLELAFQAGIKRLGLFHHNQERQDTEVDEIVEASHKVIAQRGKTLECFAVGAGMTFDL